MNKKEILKNLILVLEESSSSSSSSSNDTLSNSESSSEKSDDEDETIYQICTGNRLKRTRVRNYFEEIVPSYSENEFRTHFKMNRSLFNSLTQKFENSAEYRDLRADKRSSADKNLAVFLWFAGHESCSFRDIADRFHISLWTVSQMIGRVLKFLSNLAEDVIIWPDEDRKKEIAQYFKEREGFPAVIGVIDATHIAIDPPKTEKDDYIDRENCYSICLQGICDHEGKFIDISVGFPGSLHNTHVLQNSPIFKDLEALCGGYYMLGDSAYPSLKYLLTPYKDNGHLSTSQKSFNRKLNSCRGVIEHVFGVLKQKFRQLYYCKLKGMEKLCHFIRACCVLHNLVELEDLEVSTEVVSGITAEDEGNTAFTTVINQREMSRGKAFRDSVCGYLASHQID